MAFIGREGQPTISPKYYIGTDYNYFWYVIDIHMYKSETDFFLPNIPVFIRYYTYFIEGNSLLTNDISYHMQAVRLMALVVLTFAPVSYISFYKSIRSEPYL